LAETKATSTKRLDRVLLHEFLEESARKYPDKVALVEKEERWTYRRLMRSEPSSAFAAGPGDSKRRSVAIFLDNSVER